MEIIYFLTIGSWAFGLLVGLYRWLGMSTVLEASPEVPTIAVLIPVRNELKNLPALLEDLAHQTKFPSEVWILDDHSTDGLVDWLAVHQKSFPFQLHLWTSDRPENSFLSPKKYALSHLVPIMSAEWILTLDGDCRVNSRWVETMAIAMKNAHFVAGPISFITNRSLFSKCQVVELASLQFTAAVTLSSGQPTMCSAANMGFRRALFPGYADNLTIASGDDEFLMHAYHALYPGKVVWVKSPEALVQTHPQSSFSSFFHQRKRWASKWNRYQSWTPTLLAIWVFFVNLVTIGCLVTGNLGPVWLRWSVEFLVLSAFLGYFKQIKFIWLIPLVQLVYPFYVVIFGILAQKKSTYEWKGRKWAS